MILLLKLIGITSLLVLGYTIITQEGMGLYRIRQWATRKKENGSKWPEPILLCHWCQPSTWAILGFAFAYGIGVIDAFTWRMIFYYPLVVGGSSLINGLVWSYHLKSDAETEFYRSANSVADIFIEKSYEEYTDDELAEEEMYFKRQHN